MQCVSLSCWPVRMGLLGDFHCPERSNVVCEPILTSNDRSTHSNWKLLILAGIAGVLLEEDVLFEKVRPVCLWDTQDDR
jgi:hypothetical protein